MTLSVAALSRISGLIAAATAEGAHNPDSIPLFIEDENISAQDAVKALKAEKPYLFGPPDARKMTPAEYKTAKAEMMRSIARSR